MMGPIEKGIPIPTATGAFMVTDIPWESMAIGDSFIWKSSNCCGIRNSARRKNVSVKIKLLTHDKDGKRESYRVWRIG